MDGASLGVDRRRLKGSINGGGRTAFGGITDGSRQVTDGGWGFTVNTLIFNCDGGNLYFFLTYGPMVIPQVLRF